MAVNYQKCRIDQVKPGMVLGTDVLSARGKVMLSADTTLSEAMVRRLLCWGFETVDILEDDTDSTARKTKKQSDRLVFNNLYAQAVSQVRTAFDEIHFCKEVPLDKMYSVSEEIMDSLAGTPGVLGYLHSLRSVDNYTFQHSINVSIIVGVLGKWLEYDAEKLRQLVLAGLLHDIGKALVPQEILNKPGRLSPYEMENMQRHAILGYELLQKTQKLSPEILAGVWQHHERMDGSGYPRGISGDQILPLARIIAIADIYDAMTSDRVYRNSLTPFSVIRTLFESMFDKLDASICTVFLNNMKDYFVGTIVKLSDGRLGEVIYMDWLDWDRVTVRVSDGTCIRINEHKELEIVQMFTS